MRIYVLVTIFVWLISIVDLSSKLYHNQTKTDAETWGALIALCIVVSLAVWAVQLLGIKL